MVWYADLPDDSASTVTIGPDGSLYVTMLGIFSILAIDDRPTLGLIKLVQIMRGPQLNRRHYRTIPPIRVGPISTR